MSIGIIQKIGGTAKVKSFPRVQIGIHSQRIWLMTSPTSGTMLAGIESEINTGKFIYNPHKIGQFSCTIKEDHVKDYDDEVILQNM